MEGLHTDVKLLPECGETPRWSGGPVGHTTTFLSTFITGKKNWQTGHFVHAGFDKMKRYVDSVLNIPVSEGTVLAVVIHDNLKEEMTRDVESERMRFHKVDIDSFEKRIGITDLGVNDIRFLLALELIRAEPTWSVIFMTDLFDIKINHNPRQHVAGNPDKLFVGSEGDMGKPRWLKRRMNELGESYTTRFEEASGASGANWKNLSLYNAGISGGTRQPYMKFLVEMEAILLDPNLACRQQEHQCNVNMAAFNYALRAKYSDSEIVTGYPLHTRFRLFEDDSDADFQHKGVLEAASEVECEAAFTFIES